MKNEPMVRIFSFDTFGYVGRFFREDSANVRRIRRRIAFNAVFSRTNLKAPCMFVNFYSEYVVFLCRTGAAPMEWRTDIARSRVFLPDLMVANSISFIFGVLMFPLFRVSYTHRSFARFYKVGILCFNQSPERYTRSSSETAPLSDKGLFEYILIQMSIERTVDSEELE